MNPRTVRGWMLAACLLLGSASAQITEWPTTVAPGHFLLEMDALSLTLNHDAGTDYKALGVASTFLTTGITSNLDVQVGAEMFLSQKFNSGGTTSRDSGIGDFYLRTKWRFYDDAASGTQVALLPYVKIPTNTGGVGNKSLEGGVIVPWATKLAGFTVAAMAELDFLRNEDDTGYDTFWYSSMAVHRQLTSVVGLYGEATAGKSTGGTPWEGSLGGGVTYSLTESMWWDFAVYRGLSRGAADWNHVLRFNWGF
ncbi:MAG TPA: transporter [Lacunisphaera sp.]|jgi:hypothetical protein|nr:transporter [Lacunisphaera sp.]